MAINQIYNHAFHYFATLHCPIKYSAALSLRHLLHPIRRLPPDAVSWSGHLPPRYNPGWMLLSWSPLSAAAYGRCRPRLQLHILSSSSCTRYLLQAQSVALSHMPRIFRRQPASLPLLSFMHCQAFLSPYISVNCYRLAQALHCLSPLTFQPCSVRRGSSSLLWTR